jgi:hypothetical protein
MTPSMVKGLFNGHDESILAVDESVQAVNEVSP